MKLKRTGIAVVAAQPTPATCLHQQPLLRSAPPSRYAFLAAPLAPVIATPLKHMVGHAVMSAVQLDDARKGLGDERPLSAASSPLGLQPVSPKPVDDGRLTNRERFSCS